jgi:hypothetical protein
VYGCLMAHRAERLRRNWTISGQHLARHQHHHQRLVFSPNGLGQAGAVQLSVPVTTGIEWSLSVVNQAGEASAPRNLSCRRRSTPTGRNSSGQVLAEKLQGLAVLYVNGQPQATPRLVVD